jgi:hypothetical protein
MLTDLLTNAVDILYIFVTPRNLHSEQLEFWALPVFCYSK